MLLGALAAEVLLVAALAMLLLPGLTANRLIAALALLGAGYWLAMGQVVDPLVPNARPILIVPLKLTAATLLIAGGLLTAYSIYSGSPIILPARF